LATQVTEEIPPLLAEDIWTDRIYGADGWVSAPVALEVVQPATGAVIGSAGVADAAAIAGAGTAAAAAQRGWAATPFPERARVLRRAADLLERHADEVTAWMIRETGSIPPKAAVEIANSVNQIHQATALITQPLAYVLPSPQPDRTSVAHRIPVGVVAVITPWNFPLVLAMRSIAPALAVGNSVILKSDPNTPVVGGVLLARLFEEAGLPPGVLHCFSGGAEVGSALVEDPNVSMVTFTGSTAAGRSVGELAGRNLKRVILELGGNSPLIVLEDADIDAAASAGAFGSFLHQGQICMATSRHIVHEKIAEAYIEALSERAARLPVGDPERDEVALGPMINEKQMQRVTRIVGETVEQGARLVTGGTPEGPFYPATVLADVVPSMPAFSEEIFGPVAPVITFGDDEQAIALANGTDYGLSAAIHSRSLAHAELLAARVHSGMVHINDMTVNEDSPAPFGGQGSSGNGSHFGGVANLDLFTEWQWRTSRPIATPFPF
jgi:benzaldehyde dehydrogenase (NAD)